MSATIMPVLDGTPPSRAAVDFEAVFWGRVPSDSARARHEAHRIPPLGSPPAKTPSSNQKAADETK